jgi:hypothetical protein
MPPKVVVFFIEKLQNMGAAPNTHTLQCTFRAVEGHQYTRVTFRAVEAVLTKNHTPLGLPIHPHYGVGKELRETLYGGTW